MACFSLGFIENILIWLVIIGAVIALIKLLMPLVANYFGAYADVIVQALTIIVKAIIVIFIIVVIFDLIACLLGMGSMRLR